MCWSPVWEGVQLISSSWGFVLLLSEGAPLGLLMAFPLRGVELISSVSKICHYDFNCPSCTQKCWKQSQSFNLFIYFVDSPPPSTRAAALTGRLNICTLYRGTAQGFAVKSEYFPTLNEPAGYSVKSPFCPFIYWAKWIFCKMNLI